MLSSPPNRKSVLIASASSLKFGLIEEDKVLCASSLNLNLEGYERPEGLGSLRVRV
jgi:hypothetical protein